MFYHEYSLTACGPLNARAAEVCRKGALIKTDEGGYGCIQPWPELGDATLPEELDALRKGRPLPLGSLETRDQRSETHVLDGNPIPV